MQISPVHMMESRNPTKLPGGSSCVQSSCMSAREEYDKEYVGGKYHRKRMVKQDCIAKGERRYEGNQELDNW